MKINSYPISILYIEPASDLTGVTQIIARTVKYLSKDIFQVHFAASGNDGAHELMQSFGAQVHTIGIDYSLFTFFTSIKQLRALVKDNKIKIVHAHTAKAGFLACYALKNTNTKVVFTGHGWRYLQLKKGIKRFFIKLAEKYIARKATVLTFSTKSKAFATDFVALYQGKIELISTSIDVQEKRISEKEKEFVRVSHSISVADFLVVMVGRISAQKDPNTFLSVIEDVVKQRRDVHFCWIGAGELYEYFTNEIKKRGIEKYITTTGSLANSDAKKLLAASDYMLFTSVYEGLPVSILEAMSQFIPVISAAVGGIPDIISPGITGELFVSRNVKEASSKLLRLLGDPVLSERISTTAHDMIRSSFSPIEKMSSKLTIVYKKIT